MLSSIVNASGGKGGGGVAVRLTKGEDPGRTIARALLLLDGDAPRTSASNSAATLLSVEEAAAD